MSVNWIEIYGSKFKGGKALVTGGAGFIGSHIVQALVALGADVVVVDDLSGGSWSNHDGFGANVKRVQASILDEAAVEKEMAGCRWVFHEAALASVPQSVAEPDRFYKVNVMGTLSVLKAAAAAKVGRVMYAGSSSAYGDPPEMGPKHEKLPALPVSPYAATKLAGEEMMRAWSHSYGVDTAVLRYFNVFGPRQNANSAYAAVIAAFASAFAAGRRPMIFGDGEQTRDFVQVSNVVHANLLAAVHEGKVMGEVFNVGTGKCVTVNELYKHVAAAMGKADVAPDYRPGRAGDVLHSTADVSKAVKVLGYKPVVEFGPGVAETVAWYRSVAK